MIVTTKREHHTAGLASVNTIHCIPDGARILMFTRPVLLEYSRTHDGIWECKDDSTGINAFGRTRKEAMYRYKCIFPVLWDEIAYEEDANLTNSAIALKQRMKKVVVEVEAQEIGTITSPETSYPVEAERFCFEIGKEASRDLSATYLWT